MPHLCTAPAPATAATTTTIASTDLGGSAIALSVLLFMESFDLQTFMESFDLYASTESIDLLIFIESFDLWIEPSVVACLVSSLSIT